MYIPGLTYMHLLVKTDFCLHNVQHSSFGEFATGFLLNPSHPLPCILHQHLYLKPRRIFSQDQQTPDQIVLDPYRFENSSSHPDSLNR